MVALIKLLVLVIKVVIALNKFGLLDEFVSDLYALVPAEYQSMLDGLM